MLKKDLKFSDVFSLASGAMISSGIFVLPGLAFEKTGPSMILCYVLAGFLYIPILFAQAELATALPKSGGGYFFVERAMGSLLGTAAGLVNWLSLGLKAAFAFVGIGTLALLFPFENKEMFIKPIALAACFFFGLINCVSVKSAGKLQKILVAMLLAILSVYIIGSLKAVQPENYKNFFSGRLPGFMTVTAMVFVSYGGLTKVVDVAGEIENPKRNLPLGMLTAFFIVNILYALVVFVTVGILDIEVLKGSPAPIAQGAFVTLGYFGKITVGIAAFLAFATTGNAGILAASRSPMAMARDGLAPKKLCTIHEKFQTPMISIIFTTSIMAIAIAFLSLEGLVKAASAMLMLSFIKANASLIIMRQSGLQGYRPAVKTPFYPWFPVVAIILYSCLLFSMGKTPLIITCCVYVIATILYFSYGRKGSDREPAIRQMLRKLMELHLKRMGIEDELMGITLERDEIALDRFDKMVQTCPVFDIDEEIDSDQLFERIADALHGNLNVDKAALKEEFSKREKDVGTVLESGLAVPHALLKGENTFGVALIRSEKGIRFPSSDEPVKIAFALAGTPDQRRFHLQALSAIAATVQEPGFRERWFAADNGDQLRDVVLLSGRRRF